MISLSRIPYKGLSGALALTLAAQPCLPAANPISVEELQQEAAAATRTREQNRTTVQNFLATAQAEQALRAAHLNVKQVRSADSSLSDEDLAKLAARAENAQKDLAAGALSERDLLLILVGIAVIILIIVAVR